MSRQVNFYMAPSDEREFLDFVLQTGDVWIVLETSPSRKPQLMRRLPKRGEARFWDTVSLLNKDISSKVVLEYIRAQGYYSVDRSDSPVIEFSRSIRRAGRLSRGRLWVELRSLDSRRMVFIPKDSELGRWYDAVAGWIRKRYKRLWPLIYAGPGALELKKKGVRFFDDE